MTRVENDTTRDPQPAVIIAGPRTGGTFLAHGLSNHPNVYCERQEVIHVNSSYRLAGLGLAPADILRIVWGQSGYLVSACKLQYSQAGYPGIWELIQEREAKIIHLRRHNKTRQAVSLIINQLARDSVIAFHPQHARSTPQRISVTIEPERLQKAMGKLVQQEREWQSRILESGLPVLQLSYRKLIGKGVVSAQEIAPDTTTSLCRFLSVTDRPMPVGIRRINPWRLDRMIENWCDIEPLLGKGEFISHGEVD